MQLSVMVVRIVLVAVAVITLAFAGALMVSSVCLKCFIM